MRRGLRHRNQSAPAQNPVPAISSLSTASPTQFAAAATQTVTGTGFVPTSVINIGGSPVATTFVSSTSLTCALPAAGAAGSYFDLPATYAFTVTNTAPGGGTSSASNMVVGAFANIKAHYRGDLGITLNSTKVSAWANQTAVGDSNYNLTQGTAGKQPVYTSSNAGWNNKPTMAMVKANQTSLISGTFSAALAQPITTFLACTITTVDAVNVAVMFDVKSIADGRHRIGAVNAGTNASFFAGGVNIISGTATLATKSVVCAVADEPSNFLKLFQNDMATPIASQGADALATGALGSIAVGRNGFDEGNNSDGTLAEVIVVNASLSQSDRTLISNYLKARYSIA